MLPEGDEDRILRAADQVLLRRGIVRPDAARRRGARSARGPRELGRRHSTRPTVVDPATSPLRERFAERVRELRAHKGVTVELAYDLVADASYFGTMMVHAGPGRRHGLRGGAHHGAHDPAGASRSSRRAPGVSVVSSVFFMCLADRVLVYGDCAVNPDPNAEQLADIAISSARTAARSASSRGSRCSPTRPGRRASGADVEKVRAATELVRERAPGPAVEGPIQYDAAVDPPRRGDQAAGDSAVAGRATVLIFPDLNTGNNTYKAVQRSAGAVAIGPVLQGLRKPVNDLSRGALVRDIVNTVAITAIQAQVRE